jgi:hypothetical protein
MKNSIFSFFLLFLFAVFKTSAQDFQITQLKLEFNGNQLLISYNIDNKNPSEKFHITIQIKGERGDSIEPKTVTGDIGDRIKPGANKRITWDLGKDEIYIDGDISVQLFGEKSIDYYSKGSLMLRSIVFPGWGQTKITGQPCWLVGVAAYGAFAGGIVYYNKCVSTADLYNNPLTPQYKKAALEDKGNKEFLNSRIFSLSAASIWVANIIWVAVMPNQKQPVKHAKLYIKPLAIPDYQGAMLSLRVDF